MKIALMPINRQMDNENVLHTNNGIFIIIRKNDIMNLQEKIYKMYIKQIDSKSERQNSVFLLIYIWFIVMKWKIYLFDKI